ncbi:UTP--glucose-1-phosphate uridylyltransferase AglF [uncultured archaeon]|nr:UTP--glucose-1-phosphate uridylyltransferase AglF [uncultured archaeon]
MKIRQAFVLAGGKGERLRPSNALKSHLTPLILRKQLTDEIPKPLVLVAGKPILEYNIELLASHGVKEIILATGYMHNKIEEHFGDGRNFGVEIIYSEEKEPLGTGGALKAAENMLDESFFMVNGDNIADFHLSEMAKKHFTKKAQATIALTEVDDISGFGVAKVDGERILEFVEKPEKGKETGRFVNAGTYVIEKKALELLPEGFSLIEKAMFPQLAKAGKLYCHMHKGLWLTTDTFERLERAENAIIAGAKANQKGFNQ